MNVIATDDCGLCNLAMHQDSAFVKHATQTVDADIGMHRDIVAGDKRMPQRIRCNYMWEWMLMISNGVMYMGVHNILFYEQCSGALHPFVRFSLLL